MEKKASRRNFLAAGLSLPAAGIGASRFARPPVGLMQAAAAPEMDTAYKGPKMTVELHLGVPTLFVDGKPNVGRAYYGGHVREKAVKAFGDAGVDFVSFIYSGSKGPRGSARHAWESREVYDFSDFDESVHAILKANPTAKIFPRVVLFAPQWWLDENPGECMVYHDGTTVKPLRGGGASAMPAWSSQKWREDTALYLRKLIGHVAAKPYAASIAGYHLASGGTEEWYYWPNWRWFFFQENQDIVDYSKPQAEAFRRYLRAKYGTEAGLRAAWHYETVTFETAQIAPTILEMLSLDPNKLTDLGDEIPF